MKQGGFCLFQVSFFLWAVLCTVFLLCSVWPGAIYGDAYRQFQQALGVIPLRDDNPPMMAWLWYIDFFIFRTMLAWNGTLIAMASAGLYFLLLPMVKEKTIVFLLFPALLFAPFFFVPLTQVYQDTVLASFLLLIVGLIFYRDQQRGKCRVFLNIGIFLLLFMASFLRANAPFITAALFLYLLLGWRFHIFSNVLAIMLSGLLISLSPIVNHTILRAKAEHQETSLAIFDLGGMSYYSQQNLFPILLDDAEKKAVLSRHIEGHDFTDGCYWPDMWDSYAVWNAMEGNQCANITKKILKDRYVLMSAWKHNILVHPIVYLKHRIVFFTQAFLRNWIHAHPTGNYMWGVSPGIYEGVSYASAEEHSWLRFYYHWIKRDYRQPYFFPSLILALSVTLYSMTSNFSKAVRVQLANCITFSAVLYLLAYFVIGIANCFRYALPALWLDITAIILLCDRAVFKEFQENKFLFFLGLSLGGIIAFLFIFIP